MDGAADGPSGGIAVAVGVGTAAGNGALFTREDAVEAAWAVVDPVLRTHHPVQPYKRGSWGPKEADALIAADGGWYNPVLERA